jgi:fucose 4-O-acetylase-like acetyltransferase
MDPEANRLGGAPAAGPVPAGTVRLTWIDQSRWTAIVLVVAGHAAGLLRESSGLAVSVSNFVYMFHIPVLILLAGWGARHAEASGRNLLRIWWQLLLPYLLFQLVAFGVNYSFENTLPSWTFAEQTFGLWFLVALAAWRLAGPWFRGLRGAVPIAVVLALLAGMSPEVGGFLSLSRVLVFLPLFLAGPWIVEQVARWRALPIMRLAGAAVLATGAVVVALEGREFWRGPFLGNAGYQELGLDSLEGMLSRIVVLLVGAAMATGFMLVLPGSPGAPSRVGAWVAEAGRHTMYPYLLHLPMLTIVGASALVQVGPPTLRTLAFLAASVAFCVLTVSRPVRFLTQIMVEPHNLVKAANRLRAT